MPEPNNNSVIGESTVPPHLVLTDISRSFKEGRSDIQVLSNINMTINAGETVALIGPSGAGKSTLLQVAGLLDKPNSGEIYIKGIAGAFASDRTRTRIRRSEIGFVYQFHHLLPEFSAQENVALPQMINGLEKSKAMERAVRILSDMELEHRLNHKPAELSGGERQRVAIARAVANSPSILLADEPTGNLDPKTSVIVFEALASLVKGSNLTALVATHNMDLAKKMDRCISLSDRTIVEVTDAIRTA